MRYSLSSIAVAVFLSLVGAPAHAGLLTLDFQGLTSTSSTLAGTPIAAGTAYEIQAVFDPTLGTAGLIDNFFYQTMSLTATVGGVSFLVTDPGDFLVDLGDTSTIFNLGNFAYLVDPVGNSFGATYSTTSPPLNAGAPTPTTFSGIFLGTASSNVIFSTASGPLVLDFDPNVGVGASIIGPSFSSVPEPSSLAMCGIASVIGLAVARVRRKRVA